MHLNRGLKQKKTKQSKLNKHFSSPFVGFIDFSLEKQQPSLINLFLDEKQEEMNRGGVLHSAIEALIRERKDFNQIAWYQKQEPRPVWRMVNYCNNCHGL